MRSLALTLSLAASVLGVSLPAFAQPRVMSSATTVMIVVEPNRTRVGGRDLRVAVSRSLGVAAVPVSFPRATEATAWVAVSPAANGKIAMRIRRANGRGASRVERAPRSDVLPWLVEGVRWLLTASQAPDAEAAITEPGTAAAPRRAPAGAAHRHPLLASEEDLERDLRENDLSRTADAGPPAEHTDPAPTGAAGLTAPQPRVSP